MSQGLCGVGGFISRCGGCNALPACSAHMLCVACTLQVGDDDNDKFASRLLHNLQDDNDDDVYDEWETDDEGGDTI
jgi:hypothetical protein